MRWSCLSSNESRLTLLRLSSRSTSAARQPRPPRAPPPSPHPTNCASMRPLYFSGASLCAGVLPAVQQQQAQAPPLKPEHPAPRPPRPPRTPPPSPQPTSCAPSTRPLCFAGGSLYAGLACHHTTAGSRPAPRAGASLPRERASARSFAEAASVWQQTREHRDTALSRGGPGFWL